MCRQLPHHSIPYRSAVTTESFISDGKSYHLHAWRFSCLLGAQDRDLFCVHYQSCSSNSHFSVPSLTLMGYHLIRSGLQNLFSLRPSPHGQSSSGSGWNCLRHDCFCGVAGLELCRSYHNGTWALCYSDIEHSFPPSYALARRCSELQALVFDLIYIQFKPKGAGVTLYF